VRATVAIDDEILARAQELTGINKKSHLILEAMNALIQRERAPLGDAGRKRAANRTDSSTQTVTVAWFSSHSRSRSTSKNR
jgi:Arc/MetJ family transcription regulator